MSDSSLGSSYILLFNLCNNPVSQGLLFSPSSFQRVNWATQRGNLICLDCSMPGLRVHYQLPEFTQTHVHWVSDAIQPFHPLSTLLLLPSKFPSIRVFSNESFLLIRWPKYWSFSFSISSSASVNIQDWFPLGLIGLISLQSKGLSRVFSSTTVQKHQFLGAQLSL